MVNIEHMICEGQNIGVTNQQSLMYFSYEETGVSSTVDNQSKDCSLNANTDPDLVLTAVKGRVP